MPKTDDLVGRVAASYPVKLTGDTWQRSKWDVEFFAKAYLGIRLHPGQVEFANAYLRRTSSGWRAQYLNITVSAGNRAGKTLTLAIIILHSCVFRMGLEPPEDFNDPVAVNHWGEMPYHWWHFAVEQGPAEQVFGEIATILGGTHAAQKRGCPWTNAMGEGDRLVGVSRIATLSNLQDQYEWATGPKERSEYAWIKFAKEFGGAEVHFRSTKAKALSAIGQNMHGLSFDEAGLEPTLTYLLEEVMHARRLTTGGQFIVISTPSVATSTEFMDLWYKGDPDDPFRDPRRMSLRMSSTLNIGFGMDRETYEALIVGQSEGWIKQNIHGEFIQAHDSWFSKPSVDFAFKEDIPEHEDPVIGMVYLQALDPGLKDKCWSLVFRVTRNGKVRGVSIDRMVGKQTTPGIVALGARDHTAYAMGGRTVIITGVDTTALGGHMFRDLILEAIESIRSIEFGGNGKVKRDMLSDLRSLFDEGRIEMPSGGYWEEVRKQCHNYKLLDRKIEQDLVMALAIIAKLFRSAPRSADEPPSLFDYGPDDKRSGKSGPDLQKSQAEVKAQRERANFAAKDARDGARDLEAEAIERQAVRMARNLRISVDEARRRIVDVGSGGL